MINDKTYRRLIMSVQKEKNIETASVKCGISDKTARKYLKSDKLPSELKKPHDWITRSDPFTDVWNVVTDYLGNNRGLEAKYFFHQYLQKEYPGKFQDGQLRTFQRKVKKWKATEGPAKEVFFPQVHKPGELAEGDFTDMNDLGITIQGEPYDHLLFHFVLTYSNWETGEPCPSESFESLSEGFQNALWKLGRVPQKFRTDRLTAAIYKDLDKKKFTDRYKDLLKHYKIKGEYTQADSPNENGDVEQRHYRFKTALGQSLILRGSCDFKSREAYHEYLNAFFKQINTGREELLKEEMKMMKILPACKLDAHKEILLTVRKSSTINVAHNTYSVDSRLINEKITVHLKAGTLNIYYGSKKIDTYPRLRGSGNHRIDYRHIIDSLIRKPGAFENYRYRDDMFPTINFRMVYDHFKQNNPDRSSKKYLEVLYLASREGESIVDSALRTLFDEQKPVSPETIMEQIKTGMNTKPVTDVEVSEVDLKQYDDLMENLEVPYGQDLKSLAEAL